MQWTRRRWSCAEMRETHALKWSRNWSHWLVWSCHEISWVKRMKSWIFLNHRGWNRRTISAYEVNSCYLVKSWNCYINDTCWGICDTCVKAQDLIGDGINGGSRPRMIARQSEARSVGGQPQLLHHCIKMNSFHAFTIELTWQLVDIMIEVPRVGCGGV